MKDAYQVSLKLILKNHRGETLILKAQQSGSYAGYYDLPGGRIERREFKVSISRILSREILEELGPIRFRFSPVPVGFGRHRIPGPLTRSGKDISVLYLFFEGHLKGGTIKMSSEHEGIRWVKLTSRTLPRYFTSGMLEGLRMYLKK